MNNRYAAFSEALKALETENRLRAIPECPPSDMIDLLSNDYMGLATDRDSLPLCWDGLENSFRERYCSLLSSENSSKMTSSSASRLLSIRQEWFSLLEEILGKDYGRPALIFNSGYHANVGVIGALNLPGTFFIVDKLMHASGYDGLFAAKLPFDRFPHNNVDKLAAIISKRRDEEGYNRFVIITESIFSMDGDRAPLHELSALRNENSDTLLYVDEAHGFGCFGAKGLGLCEEYNLIDDIDIIIGTFGKAAASMGAFAVAASPVREYLVNSARSFIFSTALPPVVIRNSLENYLRLRGAVTRRERLKELSASVNQLIGETNGKSNSSSQIVPIMAGSAENAIRISEHLKHSGILALPIRRPTVPPGSERVRLSLSATLPDSFTEILKTSILSLLPS